MVTMGNRGDYRPASRSSHFRSSWRIFVACYCISVCSGSMHAPFRDNFLLVSSLHTDYTSSDVLQVHMDINRTRIPLPGISGYSLYDAQQDTVIFSTRTGLRSARLHNIFNQVLIDDENVGSRIGIDPQHDLVFSDFNSFQMMSMDGKYKHVHEQRMSSHNFHFVVNRLYKQIVYLYGNSIMTMDYDGDNQQVFYKVNSTKGNFVITDMQIDYSDHAYIWHELEFRANGSSGNQLFKRSFDAVNSDTSATALLSNKAKCNKFSVTEKILFCWNTINEDLTIHMYDKTDFSKSTPLQISNTTFSANERLMIQFLSVYESTSYNKGTPKVSLCAKNRCSDYCIPKNSTATYVCACPAFHFLHSDNETCIDTFHHHGDETYQPSVVYTGVFKKETSGHVQSTAPIIVGITGDPNHYLTTGFTSRWDILNDDPNLINKDVFGEIDVNSKSGQVVLFEKHSRRLKLYDLNNVANIDNVQHGSSPEVNGIAIDWVHDNVYWTDSLYNWIRMKYIGSEALDTSKIMIDSQLTDPHGIAVDPTRGVMYISDKSGSASIWQYYLDGTNGVQIIRVAGGNYNPSFALTLHVADNTLYYTDGYVITQYNVDSKTSIEILQGGINSFHSLAVMGEFVIALGTRHTDQREHLHFVNITSGIMDSNNVTTFDSRVLRLKEKSTAGLSVNSKEHQPSVKSPCELNRLPCSHMCTAVPGYSRPGKPETLSRRCLCPDDMVLDHDNSCTTDPLHPARGIPHFVYLLYKFICVVAIDDASYSPKKFKGAKGAKCYPSRLYETFDALAYDANGYKVFFATTTTRHPGGTGGKSVKGGTMEVSHNIYSVSMDKPDGERALVAAECGNVKGMVLDWMTQNLYWTDEKSGTIWVKNVITGFSKKVMSGLHSPYAIEWMYNTRTLVWSERDSKHVYLRTLDDISGLDTPYTDDSKDDRRITSISYNVDKADIYFLEHKTNNIMELNTINKYLNTLVQFEDNRTMFGVTNIKDFIAFTDENALHIFNTDSMEELHVSGLPHPNGVVSYKAYDIVTLYKGNQPDISEDYNPADDVCWSLNGGCSQLCFMTKSGKPRCECEMGMVLASDNITCVTKNVLKDNFFLLADYGKSRIFQFNENVTQLAPIGLPANELPNSLDYDFRSDRVYWSDQRDSDIQSITMGGHMGRRLHLYQQELVAGKFAPVAFLHGSDSLYYVDGNNSSSVIMTDSKGHYHVTIVDDLPGIVSLVLRPTDGYLFVLTYVGDTTELHRYDLDGHNHVILSKENSRDGEGGHGLTCDGQGTVFYWIYDRAIVSLNVKTATGNTTPDIVHATNNWPIACAYLDNKIYYTEKESQSVYRLDLATKSSTKLLDGKFFDPTDLKFFNRKRDTAPTKCTSNNGGCDLFCLPLPSSTKTCMCQKKGQRGKPCKLEQQCPEYFPYGNVGNCHIRVGGVCNVTCSHGYAPVNQTITCMPGLKWNVDTDSICQPVYCSVLQTPNHGELDSGCDADATQPGQLCYQNCLEGYMPAAGHTKDQSMYCDRHQVWQGKPLKCIRNQCLYKQMEFGSLTCPVDEAVPGTSCHYTCNDEAHDVLEDDQHDEGHMKIICQNDLTWSYDLRYICQQQAYPDNFMFVVDNSEIRQLHMSNFSKNGSDTIIASRSVFANVNKGEHVLLKYSQKHNIILYISGAFNSIQQINVYGQQMREPISFDDDTMLWGIEIDDTEGLVFFYSYGHGEIRAASFLRPRRGSVKVVEASYTTHISVDSLKRKLYYIASGKLSRVNFDGSKPEVIRTLTSHRSSMAIDLPARRIYLYSHGSPDIFSVDMEGYNKTNIMKVKEDLMSINFDKNFIYFTLSDEDYLLRIAKSSHVFSGNFTRYRFQGIKYPTISDMYMKSYQNKYPKSICEKSTCYPSRTSSKTTSICLTGNSGQYLCRCQIGTKLVSNGHDCVVDMPTDKMADLLWLKDIRKIGGLAINMTNFEADKTANKNFTIPYGPDTDYTLMAVGTVNRTVFLYDPSLREIYKWRLDIGGHIKLINKAMSSDVSCLSFDWTAGNLYWYDSTYNWIKVLSTHNGKSTTINDNFRTRLNQLVVHPKLGKMYYSDSGSLHRVYESALNGSGHARLRNTKLKSDVTAMSIDEHESTLYMVVGNSIFQYHVISHIFRMFPMQASSFPMGSIAVNKNFLFVSRQNSSSIQVFHTDNFNSTFTLATTSTDHTDMRMMSKDSQPVLYKSPCGANTCDHICVPMAITNSNDQVIEYKAECICEEGFEYNSHTKQCTTTMNPTKPSFIFATDNSICSTPFSRKLEHSRNFVPAVCNNFSRDLQYDHRHIDGHAPSITFKHLDFNFHMGFIYMTTKVVYNSSSFVRNNIMITSIPSQTRPRMYLGAMGEVTGIAVDWTSGNVYWSDASLKAMLAGSPTGMHFVNLHKRLSNPRSPLIYVTDGLILWLESNSTGSKIGRSYFDGSSKKYSQLSTKSYVRTIAADEKMYRIYWLTGSTLHWGYLNDMDRGQEFTLNERIGSIMSMTFVQRTLAYTTTNTTLSLHLVGLSDLAKGPDPEFSSGDNLGQTHDVIAYHPRKQLYLPRADRCSRKEGRQCAQLCISIAYGQPCMCTDGMKVAKDRFLCQPALTPLDDNFFLVSDSIRKQIYQFDPDSGHLIGLMTSLPYIHNKEVEFDFETSTVMYTSMGFNKLLEFKLNYTMEDMTSDPSDSHTESKPQKSSMMSSIEGIAYESSSKMLYYVEKGRDVVEVMHLPSKTTKVIFERLHRPRGIVLDSENCLMYISCLDDKGKGQIVRLDLIGKASSVVVKGLNNPMAVHIDFKTKKFYYTEQSKISVASYAGYYIKDDAKVMYQGEDHEQPASLAVHGHSVIWSDKVERGLYTVAGNRVHPRNGPSHTKKRLFEDVIWGPMSIKYFSRSAIVKTPCSIDNGHCSHFCIPVKPSTHKTISGLQRKCECPDNSENYDVVETVDEYNCPGVVVCPIKFDNAKINMASCTRRANSTCVAECAKGYRKRGSTDMKIICGVKGEWSSSGDQLCVKRNPDDTTTTQPITTQQSTSSSSSSSSSGTSAPTDTTSHSTTLYCPRLPLSEHAKWDNAPCLHTVGSVCKQSCMLNETKSFTGDTKRTCLKAGYWSGSPLKCSPYPGKVKKGLSSVAIVFIVLSVLVLFAAILIGAILFVMKRRGYQMPFRIPRVSLTRPAFLRGRSPFHNMQDTDGRRNSAQGTNFNNPGFNSDNPNYRMSEINLNNNQNIGQSFS